MFKSGFASAALASLFALPIISLAQELETSRCKVVLVGQNVDQEVCQKLDLGLLELEYNDPATFNSLICDNQESVVSGQQFTAIDTEFTWVKNILDESGAYEQYFTAEQEQDGNKITCEFEPIAHDGGAEEAEQSEETLDQPSDQTPDQTTDEPLEE